MVLGFHFIFSAYGFWLPNDPRGSWSETIRQYELLRFGPATKSLITTTRSVASKPHDEATRLAAKAALRYPPVKFTGIQARAIAGGFRTAAQEGNYLIHALAILHDHVHVVIARHHRHIDEIAAHLKSKATRQMTQERIHPLAAFASTDGRKPSPWARNHWCPFIDTEEYMHTAIHYVERNPVKSGLRAQKWPFVVPYRDQAP
jgi:REP element-mobilizing transposase RayT